MQVEEALELLEKLDSLRGQPTHRKEKDGYKVLSKPEFYTGNMKCHYEIKNGFMIFYINGLMFFSFEVKNFKGVHTYIDSNCKVEIYFKDSPLMLLELNSRVLWENVLKNLNQFIRCYAQ
jgi:hypothetical protein